MGEDTQGVPGEGAKRAAVSTVSLTPALASPKGYPGERGSKDCVRIIRHRNSCQEHLAGSTDPFLTPAEGASDTTEGPGR